MKKHNEKYYLYDLKAYGDERGQLIALEANKNLPFDVKRVYYIYDTKKGVPRGYHAHKDLEQVLICVNGCCKIKLDDGLNSEIFELSSPDTALYVGKNLWREMFDFSQGCVLVVLASDYYNPDEYIRDYDEFLKEVAK